MAYKFFKTPRVLLGLEVDEYKIDDLHDKRKTSYELKIVTDKGIYIVSGCGNCNAIFIEKDQDET